MGSTTPAPDEVDVCIAIEAADLTLMRGDLNGVASAIARSRRTMRTMRQNLFWAFVYNVLGIPWPPACFIPSSGCC